MEGGGGEESTDGATRILEDAAGSDEDETNIFLRDASATKGIHCRLGMDGVSIKHHIVPNCVSFFVCCQLFATCEYRLNRRSVLFR